MMSDSRFHFFPHSLTPSCLSTRSPLAVTQRSCSVVCNEVFSQHHAWFAELLKYDEL